MNDKLFNICLKIGLYFFFIQYKLKILAYIILSIVLIYKLYTERKIIYKLYIEKNFINFYNGK
jgi:hypothetical protein